MAVLEVRGLRKSYPGKGRAAPVEAVRGIDLHVERGEVFALLGPNGAGKTTTLAVLEGYTTPTSGSVSVLGQDPSGGGRALRERLGIVLQDLSVEPFLTVREMLTHYGRFYPDPRPVDEVISLVGLEQKAGARAHTLSGGQQRRLDLALGIIGRPELLFLDEPTTGFDPSARRESWDLVRELCRGGTTVLLTTHYMDEAQALADRLAVIAAGQIVAEGTPDSLGGRDTAAVRVRFRPPEGTVPGDLPMTPTHYDAGVITVEAAPGDELALLHRLTGWALDAGVALTGLTVDRPSLEDTYLALTAATEAGVPQGEPQREPMASPA